MPHIHAHSILKHGKSLIPHAGFQNTSRSFHKQVDKLPHKSRHSVATYQNEREETLENALLQKGLMESRKETNVN